MAHLYIDNQEVALSEGTSIEIVESNPYFGRDGEYSLDIDIDLSIPQNRKIYLFADRLASQSRLSGRKARLMERGECVLSGTEIILAYDKEHVRVQIVSGNSELNYLANDKEYIDDITMDEVTPTAAAATASLASTYPGYNYACPPLVTYVGSAWDGTTFSAWNYNMVEYSFTSAYAAPRITSDADGNMAQPYLLYIMRKVVERMGYSIRNNWLQDSVFARLIVVNSEHPGRLQINKVLPHWTISEFLTEVENLFNVYFIVDKVTKAVDILDRNSFHEATGVIYLKDDDILEVERNFDANAKNDIDYTNVRYDFPSGKPYCFWDMEPEVLALAKINSTDSFYVESTMNENRDKPIIYQYSLGFSFYPYTYVTDSGKEVPYIHQVQKFQRHGNGEGMRLRILPGELTWVANDSRMAMFIRCTVSGEEEVEVTSYTDKIIDGIEEEKRTDRMYVVFYDGLRPYLDKSVGQLYVQGSWGKFPTVHTCEYEQVGFKCGRFTESGSLQLHGYSGLFAMRYSNASRLDVSERVVIRFKGWHLNKVRYIWVIKGVKFYCKSLKRSLGAGSGTSEIIEGEFYRVV